jgi:NTE family protein
MNKIGLVLSGGGARGFAHLGLIKVLEECGIKPFMISGVSAGAIFGALYASGKSPDEIMSLAKGNSYFGISGILWRREGLFSMEAIRRALVEHLPEDNFESLKIPLVINATDLMHNKTIFFSKGPLIRRIIASASVPIIFEPVSDNETKLVDGGLLNNLPIEPLMATCDKIIGSHVNKLAEIDNSLFKFSKAAMIERCFHLSMANSVYSKSHLCDIFIEPTLYSYGLFSMKSMEDIFQIGYESALKHKERLLEVVSGK